MLTWLKGLFSSPKTFIKMAVDSLDLAVPYIAKEITEYQTKFSALNPTEKAQWLVDKVQAFLTEKFKLSA